MVLIDDVLFTGRTVRAALQELYDFGRPKSVQLAVLVDRGQRELPIQADWVPLRMTVKKSDKVEVKMLQIDEHLSQIELHTPSVALIMLFINNLLTKSMSNVCIENIIAV